MDNREMGAKPIRSRRCKGIVVFRDITVKMGRLNTMLKPESENLPEDMEFTHSYGV